MWSDVEGEGGRGREREGEKVRIRGGTVKFHTKYLEHLCMN